MRGMRLPLLAMAVTFCLICSSCSSSSNSGGQVSIATSSLPSGTVGTSYSYSVPASGGTPPYVFSLNAGTLPAGLKLSTKGVISGTPQAAGTTSFALAVVDSEAVPASATANLSITIQSELAITSVSLPAGTVGVGYSTTLTASGGVAPYTWSVASGSLPPGLNLSSGGVVSGTPASAGNFISTVQVSDSESPQQTAIAQITIAINTVTITTQSLPTGTVNVPYSTTLAAVGGLTPYTWTMTGNLPLGLVLSSAGVISGTPTSTGSTTFTVQVSDSEKQRATASQQLSITVNGGGGSGALQGNYAFYLNGFNSSGAWTLAGSLIADGNGNITGGMVDGNSASGQPMNSTASGRYTITGSGLNLMTLEGPSFGSMTLAFVLDSAGNGRIIEYDDGTGQGSRGSGALRKANASVFTLGGVTGNWAYGLAGAGAMGERVVQSGRLTASTGNISNGACATNDGGEYQTCTFAGTISAVDPITGRATASLQTENGTADFAIYLVSLSELVMEEIDTIGQATPLLVGSGLEQHGSYSNASLNGATILYMQDIHQQDGLDQSLAGILSFDGNGNLNVIAMDENLAGTLTQDEPTQGTYSVDPAGAVVIDCGGSNCPAGFLVQTNQGFFIGNGADASFGMLQPQTGGPFSNASLTGSYSAGSLAPLDYFNAINDVEVGSGDGQGTLTLSGDASDLNGLNQSLGNTLSYSVAANGRGAVQMQNNSIPAVVYVISPENFVVLESSSDARVDVFQH